MSIRMMAIELYRMMKEVEELERKIKMLGPGAPERDKQEQKLRYARAELVRIKKMLDGAKDD